jgi:hypothetical protein
LLSLHYHIFLMQFFFYGLGKNNGTLCQRVVPRRDKPDRRGIVLSSVTKWFPDKIGKGSDSRGKLRRVKTERDGEAVTSEVMK